MELSITHLGLLEDEAIDLDTAALELAALDHEDADLDPYTQVLGEISQRAADHGALRGNSHERARALAEVIAGEFGFAGDRTTYDSPDNADLIRVIDRRRGLPVSLTILYVAAARRIGWEADALNTPGHVLGRLGSETDPVLIDPFNGGAVVEAEAIAGLLSAGRASGAPSSRHLAPMSNRAVLVRLLTNQAARAEQNGNLRRALKLYRRMTVFAPEHGQAWWERARLEVAHGDPGAARASLGAMLETTRDPDVRSHINAALSALSRLSH
jgi:regulator of sirC expression with transglutaminase-like and TPR domain